MRDCTLSSPQGRIQLSYAAGPVVRDKRASKTCRLLGRVASTDKKQLDCPIFEQCSGCTLDAGLERPPLAEQAARLLAEKHPQAVFELQPSQQVTGEEKQRLSVTFHRGDWTESVETRSGWRCRAKLAVGGVLESPRIGLFGAGTHEIVDLDNCR